MTDTLFSKLAAHQANLKKNQAQLAYCNEAFHTKIGYNDIVCKNTASTNATLPKYKYFKTITLEDIVNLRANLDATNKDHLFWCKKIYRFLEFRLSSIEERIQKNYAKKEERITFIQNVVTLLLEYYTVTNDSRYLSLALKILRKKPLAKQGFLNSQCNVQYSYNIVVVHKLIKNL
ncbi:hypothetical protein [uncultured Kordia sp.]|uniref:hypothetical protein n=1 Tax=uncultured Kordia sp. TaxID=507699 RepID=UPI00261628FB|nr:hypothetical protein [uncultured Kordia sp.]